MGENAMRVAEGLEPMAECGRSRSGFNPGRRFGGDGELSGPLAPRGPPTHHATTAPRPFIKDLLGGFRETGPLRRI
ncbi:unnamed protein product [Boreogadus saida]